MINNPKSKIENVVVNNEGIWKFTKNENRYVTMNSICDFSSVIVSNQGIK